MINNIEIKLFFKLFSNCWLLIFYIIISLLIGEFHPFSKSEMYNSFPEKANIISVTDSTASPLPANACFKYSTADLTHNYYAVKQEIPLLSDTNKYFNEIGILLNNQLKQYQYKSTMTYEIRLFSISYKNQILSINSKKLYGTVK